MIPFFVPEHLCSLFCFRSYVSFWTDAVNPRLFTFRGTGKMRLHLIILYSVIFPSGAFSCYSTRIRPISVFPIQPLYFSAQTSPLDFSVDNIKSFSFFDRTYLIFCSDPFSLGKHHPIRVQLMIRSVS